MSKNISRNLNSFSNYLLRPVDASTLGAFRILFGTLMLLTVLIYFYEDWPKNKIIGREFFFTYEWFPWIAPLPGDGNYYLFGIMGVSALFIALGLFYRFSALTFLLIYVYDFLVDKAEYNNHYYLICLLGFLLCLVNADRWMSLDSLWRKKLRTGVVPHWNVLIVKAQVFIVYFYGGIAKITPDWLRGEPVRHWLIDVAQKESTPQLVAEFMKSEFAPYFFSYGGLLFDLVIGFLLVWRKTRLLAFGLIVFFNLTNNWLFNIGVFPYLMICATVIFLEPETPRRWLKKCFTRSKEPQFHDVAPSPRLKKVVVGFVSVYLVIQILLPFRHWLYEGNVNWTEEGYNFSWRMMLNSKSRCLLRILVTDPATGETKSLPGKGHVTSKQYTRMCMVPNMIIQFAHYLGGKMKEQGIHDPIITVKSVMSLNYRHPQYLIDPEVNLLEKEYSTFSHADWILPLKDERKN